jgi:hypothetical protein
MSVGRRARKHFIISYIGMEHLGNAATLLVGCAWYINGGSRMVIPLISSLFGGVRKDAELKGLNM